MVVTMCSQWYMHKKIFPDEFNSEHELLVMKIILALIGHLNSRFLVSICENCKGIA